MFGGKNVRKNYAKASSKRFVTYRQLAVQLQVQRISKSTKWPLGLASGVNESNIDEFLPYVDYFLVGAGVEVDLNVEPESKVCGALAVNAKKSYLDMC